MKKKSTTRKTKATRSVKNLSVKHSKGVRGGARKAGEKPLEYLKIK